MTPGQRAVSRAHLDATTPLDGFHALAWSPDTAIPDGVELPSHRTAAHIAQMATPGIAPGPPVAPRRRPLNWWGVASTVAGVVVILLSIIGTVAVLQRIAEL